MHKVILFLSSLFLLAVSACSSRPPEFYTELTNVSKLSLTSMSVKRLGIIDDAVWWKPGDRFAAYTYTTYLHAFVDLSQIAPTDVIVNQEQKTLTVTLPEINIEFRGRDIAMCEEVNRVSGLRSAIKPEEVARLKEEINARVVDEWAHDTELHSQLTARAREKARTFFQSLAQSHGYTAIVKFK